MKIRNGFVSNSSSSSFVYLLKSRKPNLEGVDWEEVERVHADHSYQDYTYDHQYGWDAGEVDTETVDITSDMSMEDLMKTLLAEVRPEKSKIMGDGEVKEAPKNVAKIVTDFFKNSTCIYMSMDDALYQSLREVVIPYLEETNQIAEIATVDMSSSDAGSMQFRTLEEIEGLFDEDDYDDIPF